MKLQSFDPMDPKSGIGCLHGYKMGCDRNKFYEKASLWWFPLFMKNKVAADLADRLCSKSRTLHGSVEEGVLTLYVQVVDNLLEIYATDDIVVKAGAEIVNFQKNTNTLTLKYAEAV